MALKDWKKIDVTNSNYTYFGWQHKKHKTIKLLIDFYPRGIWEVIIKDGSDSNTLKQTKTRSQALKFAKSYMRKH